MQQPSFQFHNDFGISFPRFSLAVREGGLFFRRFRGLIYPGRATSEIGRGGSGVIHVVRDEVLDRIVALKLPNDSILAEPQVRSEVLNEASQALELTHPNIVRIYDFHDEDDRWGISMQYVRGKNLDEWREKLAPHQMMGGALYDVDQIADWIRQLCEALCYVHEEAGIVHCDIKPKNLLLERTLDTRTRDIREKLLVTDFGITQKLRDHTMRTMTMHNRKPTASDDAEGRGAAGTLAYMSPQQLKGSEGTIADDIYAVGITIYELLTGRPPFYSGEAQFIQHQIESQIPMEMMARRAERGIRSAAVIPERWEAVVAQCLKKLPSERPPSARELARLLGLSVNNAATNTDNEAWKQETVRLQTTLTERENHLAEREARLADLQQELNDLRAQHARDLSEASAGDQGRVQQNNALQAELENQLTEVTRLTAQLQDLEGFTRDEVDRLRKERDAAQGNVDVHKTALQKTEDNLKSLRQELETARKGSGEVDAKMKAAEARVKQAQHAENQVRQQLEGAQARLEKELQTARQEAHTARQAVQELSTKQAAPVKPVAMLLLILLGSGILIGSLIGWITSRSSGSPLKELVQSVEQNRSEMASQGLVVTAQHMRLYLREIGVDESTLGTTFTQLQDDERTLGVSWLVAASFCEWLTQVSGNDPGQSWFDLPTQADLVRLKPSIKEWTRDEAAPSDSAASAGSRKMKVFLPSKSEGDTALRSQLVPGIGFRCILRTR